MEGHPRRPGRLHPAEQVTVARHHFCREPSLSLPAPDQAGTLAASQIAVVGGLLLSQSLTLDVKPLIDIYLHRLQRERTDGSHASEIAVFE